MDEKRIDEVTGHGASELGSPAGLDAASKLSSPPHNKMVVISSQREHLRPINEDVADCVSQHLPYLNRIVRRLTRSDSMAEDIVQQTMMKALVHADQFRFKSTVKTWLTSIAMNEVRQVYRCRWRTRTVQLMTENLESEGSSRVECPHPGYQAREREAIIRQAVSRLPEQDRCVIELCDLQLVSLQEAAARLHLTLAALKSRRQRARQKLRPFVLKLKS